MLITSHIGVNIALTSVEATLKQPWNNVETTLEIHCIKIGQRCINVGRRHFINVVQRWKSEVEFTTLKQCWSDIEMLAGDFLLIFWPEGL